MTESQEQSGRDARAAAWATATAALLVGQQVAAKATRDATYLTTFEPSDLPPVIGAAALLSVVVAVIASRYLTRRGPQRMLPWACGISGAIYALLGVGGGMSPGAMAVALYLHVAASGLVLITSFWSLLNERFDPHTAKRTMARAATGATLGGFAGGLVAERIAAWGDLSWMFYILAGTQLVAGWMVTRITQGSDRDDPSDTRGGLGEGLQILGRMPYLRNLTLMLVLVTVAGGFVDYLLKANAAEYFRRDSEGLLSFFGILYTGMGVGAFIVQGALGRIALERLGITRSIATLPVSMAVTAGAVVMFPGIVAATAMAALTRVSQNSLYRSGYELLYTPVPRAAKRATKLIIDVGFVRLGDAVAAGLVAALLMLGVDAAHTILAVSIVLIGVAALGVIRSLKRGYITSLEQSLLTQAEELDLGDAADGSMRSTLLQTFGSLDVRAALTQMGLKFDVPTAVSEAAAADSSSASASAADERIAAADPVLAQIMDLRSADKARVLARLAVPTRLHPSTVPHLIRLLAWDDVSSHVLGALRVLAPRAGGQLLDALLDADQTFAIRRRLPRALRAAEPARVIGGLGRAMSDRRFEVRYHVARALRSLTDTKHSQDGEDGGGATDAPQIPREEVLRWVRRELSVNPRVWRGLRVLDDTEHQMPALVPSSDPNTTHELASRAAGHRGLEHVFSLLSLLLPRRPVEIAYRGLLTDDPKLRGTAIEYLDSTLPDDIPPLLARMVEAVGVTVPPHGRDPRADGPRDAAKKLLASSASIDINLAELRARLTAREAAEGGTAGSDSPSPPDHPDAPDASDPPDAPDP